MITRRLLASLTAIALMATVSASNLPAEEPPLQIERTDLFTGETLKLADLAGRHVALHLLAEPAPADELAKLGEFAKRWPELSGFTHVFAKRGDAAALAAWKAAVEAAGVRSDHPAIWIVGDPDGALATAFGVEESKDATDAGYYPATTIVLDEGGTRLIALDAEKEAAFIDFDRFARERNPLRNTVADTDYNLGERHEALGGYDPVAYFNGGAKKGNPRIATDHFGVIFNFATKENRAAFAAEPDKYLPTYGGWCATAMAGGDKVEIDPENYKITNGRLFLFYNGFWGNAIKDWNKNEAELTKQADAAWNKIAGE